MLDQNKYKLRRVRTKDEEEEEGKKEAKSTRSLGGCQKCCCCEVTGQWCTSHTICYFLPSICYSLFPPLLTAAALASTVCCTSQLVAQLETNHHRIIAYIAMVGKRQKSVGHWRCWDFGEIKREREKERRAKNAASLVHSLTRSITYHHLLLLLMTTLAATSFPPHNHTKL